LGGGRGGVVEEGEPRERSYVREGDRERMLREATRRGRRQKGQGGMRGTRGKGEKARAREPEGRLT
jgi:hypothetical protein